MKNKNGIIYLINVLIFVALMPVEIRGEKFLTGGLTIGLIASYFLFKREHTASNIMKLGSYELVHVNGLICLFLFILNLALSWNQLIPIEIVYVIVFCLVQLFSISIRKVEG